MIKIHYYKEKEHIMTLQKTNLILPIILILNVSINLVGMETAYIPDVLVANPIEYLIKAKTTYDAFAQEVQNLEATKTTNQHELANLITQYKAVIEKHEQTCPLFFLNECTEETNNIQLNNNCLLSRTYKPHFREAFEKHTSKLLLEKLQSSPTTPITYTSFGCGNAFQELIIITKTLIEQPKAQLTIHLIDGVHTSYVTAVDFLGYSREITTQHNFSFGSRLEEYEQYARNKEKHDPEIQAMSCQTLKQQITFACLEQEIKYKQFLSWLQQKFSLAQISLYLHDTSTHYFNFLTKNNLAHADIITTADIDDDESLKNGSINHYAMICIKTLNAKIDAKTAWLKKLDAHNAGILTASIPAKNSTNCYFNTIKI
jgi:hypothetical protein